MGELAEEEVVVMVVVMVVVVMVVVVMYPVMVIEWYLVVLRGGLGDVEVENESPGRGRDVLGVSDSE